MKPSSAVVRMSLGAVMALTAPACAGRRPMADAPSPSSAAAARPTDSLAAYYPLAVGNRWTYRVNGREDKPVTVQILKEEDGYFHDSQGGQLTVDGFGVRDRKRYLLRGPLAEGGQWTNVVSVSSTERYRILQVDVPCQSAAGAFTSCVRVEASNRVDASTTLLNELTFARGVGLVRLELSVQKINGERLPQTSLELVSYQLNPGAPGARGQAEGAP